MKATPDKRPLNDDPELDPREIEEAEYAAPGEDHPPEVDGQTIALTQWDEAPSSSGTTAPKVHLDDEIPPGEQLVEEGVNEADREQRLAAADPDFEP